MAVPTPQIDQPSISTGLPGVSRDDLVLNEEVTLTDPANGAGPYFWEFLDIPTGSSATLSGHDTDTATFTPDIPGSYFIRVTFGASSSDIIAAVRTVNKGIRIPAAGERKQFGPRGWHVAREEMLRLWDAEDGGGGLEVVIVEALEDGGAEVEVENGKYYVVTRPDRESETVKGAYFIVPDPGDVENGFIFGINGGGLSIGPDGNSWISVSNWGWPTEFTDGSAGYVVISEGPGATEWYRLYSNVIGLEEVPFALYAPNGTASFPQYSFEESNTTGLFSPGSDLIAITAGENEAVRWNNVRQTLFNAIADSTTTSIPSIACAQFPDTGIFVSSGTGIDGDLRFVRSGQLRFSATGTQSALRGRQTTGTATAVRLSNDTNLSSSSAQQRMADVFGTVAQSGTAGYRGFTVDITESGTGSGQNRLYSGLVNTEERFRVTNLGHLYARGALFDGAAGSSLVELEEDGGVILTDASLGNVFDVVIDGNVTLANPYNAVAGFTYVWILRWDEIGGHTVSLGGKFHFPGGTLPDFDTSPGAVNVLMAVFDGDAFNCNGIIDTEKLDTSWNVRVTSNDTIVAEAYDAIEHTVGAGTNNIEFPSAEDAGMGAAILVKLGSGSSGDIALVPDGGDSIDDPTVDLPGDAKLYISDGNDRWISFLVSGSGGGGGGPLTWPLLAPDGTVSEPSYSFENDPKSGLFLLAEGAVVLSVNETMHLVGFDDGGGVAGIRVTPGSESQPGLGGIGISEAGLYWPEDGAMAVSIRNQEQMLWDEDGTFVTGLFQVAGQGGSELVNLAFNTTIAIDFNASNVIRVEMEDDVTVSNPINAVPGFSYVLIFAQNSTGGHQVTEWGSAFLFSGTPPSLAPQPFAITAFTCIYDGTYFIVTGPGQGSGSAVGLYGRAVSTKQEVWAEPASVVSFSGVEEDPLIVEVGSADVDGSEDGIYGFNYVARFSTAGTLPTGLVEGKAYGLGIEFSNGTTEFTIYDLDTFQIVEFIDSGSGSHTIEFLLAINNEISFTGSIVQVVEGIEEAFPVLYVEDGDPDLLVTVVSPDGESEFDDHIVRFNSSGTLPTGIVSDRIYRLDWWGSHTYFVYDLIAEEYVAFTDAGTGDLTAFVIYEGGFTVVAEDPLTVQDYHVSVFISAKNISSMAAAWGTTYRAEFIDGTLAFTPFLQNPETLDRDDPEEWSLAIFEVPEE
jgi:hypothetical protein